LTGVAKRHVVVARAFGLEVPHAVKPCSSAIFRRPHGARHAMRRILLQDLIVVLRLGRVSLQEHVRVDVDQTGEERAVPEVEHARSAEAAPSRRSSILPSRTTTTGEAT
jgi:hypothetical protein